MNISITLTGADDSVEPEQLGELSRKYSYVEWGILFSEKRAGTPRYPTVEWLSKLADTKRAPDSKLKLAAHFCGQYARQYFDGVDLPPRRLADGVQTSYDRIQLNGYSSLRSEGEANDALTWREHTADLHILNLVKDYTAKTFILQVSNALALERALSISRIVDNVEVLFDMSGGRGIPLTEFPPQPGSLRMGYAGGIGLHNLEDVLGKLRIMKPEFGETWVDMESSLRSGEHGDRFDLTKCEEVLKQAQHFMVKKVQLSTLYGKFAPE